MAVSVARHANTRQTGQASQTGQTGQTGQSRDMVDRRQDGSRVGT
jgi:hypothetical protein